MPGGCQPPPVYSSCEKDLEAARRALRLLEALEHLVASRSSEPGAAQDVRCRCLSSLRCRCLSSVRCRCLSSLRLLRASVPQCVCLAQCVCVAHRGTTAWRRSALRSASGSRGAQRWTGRPHQARTRLRQEATWMQHARAPCCSAASHHPRARYPEAHSVLHACPLPTVGGATHE